MTNKNIERLYDVITFEDLNNILNYEKTVGKPAVFFYTV